MPLSRAQVKTKQAGKKYTQTTYLNSALIGDRAQTVSTNKSENNCEGTRFQKNSQDSGTADKNDTNPCGAMEHRASEKMKKRRS